MSTLRFPKPSFESLLRHYQTDPETVHTCAILNPTAQDDGINTCAGRLSEALVLANGLAPDRAAIQRNRRKDGAFPLLGPYGFTTFGNLCNHGIARGARDLGDFLTHHWGRPTHAFTARDDGSAPAELDKKTGVLCFVKIPGFSGQGHVDVWNQTRAVGSGYWNSQKIWFWSLT
jgi:hypothetical protein